MGIDDFVSLKFLDCGKNTYAVTVPTQWAWKFKNGSSLQSYLEIQSKTETVLNENFSVSSEYKYLNQYLSLGYNYLGKWTLTGFFDKQSLKDKVNTWLGLDYSYFFNSENMISIFYGSQKGGMVCANGVCAEQPRFNNGLKMTFRSIF